MELLDIVAHTEPAGYLGAAVGVLVVVRTSLGALVFALDRLDVALDGKRDWSVVLHPLANLCEMFDSVLDYLPVKGLQQRTRREGN